MTRSRGNNSLQIKDKREIESLSLCFDFNEPANHTQIESYSNETTAELEYTADSAAIYKIANIFTNLRNFLRWIGFLFKKLARQFNIVDTGIEALRIPVSLFSIASYILSDQKTKFIDIIQAGNQVSDLILNSVKWIGQILFNVAKRTLGIIEIVQSVINFIPAVFEISTLCFNRWKERKNEKKQLLALQEQDGQPEYQQCKDAFERSCIKSRNRFNKQLSSAIHTILVSAIFIVASVLTLIPATTILGGLIFSFIISYSTIFSTVKSLDEHLVNNAQQKTLNPNKNDSESIKNNSSLSHNEPIFTARKKIPLPIIAFLCIPIALTLAILTGPLVASIAAALIAGCICLTVIAKSYYDAKNDFALPKNTITHTNSAPKIPTESSKSITNTVKAKHDHAKNSTQKTNNAKLNTQTNTKPHFITPSLTPTHSFNTIKPNTKKFSSTFYQSPKTPIALSQFAYQNKNPKAPLY